MRTRPGWVEPEIYFRIVHLPQNAISGARADIYEQTVEIALGPKRAFENGNIGSLARQMATAGVVSAVLPGRGDPKPAGGPKTPRVTELLRKAIEWRRQLDASDVRNQAEIARREGITRAKVTQVMALLRLAPETREHILAMPDVAYRPSITERMLRSDTVIAECRGQVREFHGRQGDTDVGAP
jgi:hypothetical protein